MFTECDSYVLFQLHTNNININCVDPLGRTALLIAIENENIEMIEMLLRSSVEIGDALLHAINEENVEAVELLLNHQVQTKGEEVSLPSNSCFRYSLGNCDSYLFLSVCLYMYVYVCVCVCVYSAFTVYISFTIGWSLMKLDPIDCMKM